MLEINGKKFMNLPEAVQWLLNNNALPFQCKVNYVADTIIAKTDIINPSPAEIKVGSLVLFADGKVGTVSGITDNGFMVGAESTDLSDGVPHITNIALDASSHLIFTMSEGDPIDAGLVKMVSSLTIDASQHLIVNYNDGTSTDLGAIFTGNVNIAGSLTADSIIENMSGYSAVVGTATNWTIEKIYVGAVKNGNKITFAAALNLTKEDAGAPALLGDLISITIPSAVSAKLYASQIGFYYFLDIKEISCFNALNNKENIVAFAQKDNYNHLLLSFGELTNLQVGDKYYVRYEVTFLLSDDIA